MGLFDNLRKQVGSQFIEIIEWLDATEGTLVYRFPVHNQEIKMGAQVTVRENQLALFVNEGKAADLFGPGLHRLSTRNVPLLTTLKGWKHGFASPFKAEVYFFNTRLYTDLKWGTASPVMMRDGEFGMLRLRAFGTYAMRITAAKTFFSTIVGTRGLTTTEEIAGQLRSSILTKFSDALAEARIPALDLASRYDELSDACREKIAPEFASFGLELARFFVENISLPEEVQSAIDQRTRLGVMGDRIGEFARLQAAEAMTMAAANPGGAAGAGLGIGAGMAMGQAMAHGMGEAEASGKARTASPGPTAGTSARWSVSIEGRTSGPYTDQAMAEMVGNGQIPADTLAWRPGAAGWAALGTYPELGHLITPPPPPGPPRRS
jgi:membrane protease subunit (stomatin/prohibitin family)